MFKIILITIFISLCYSAKLATFDGKIKILANIETSKIIAISGQARVGKSTFINNFFSQNGIIAPVSDSQKSCTKDIDFYTGTSQQGKNERITILDLEGDDMEDLDKNIKINRFAAAVSQVFIYYSRDKFSKYSEDTINYIKKYSNPIMILLVRTDLNKINTHPLFDYTFSFKDSMTVVSKIQDIIDTVPMRESSIIMRTLYENVNIKTPKIYGAVEREQEEFCLKVLNKCKSTNCDRCEIEKYNFEIKKKENSYGLKQCNDYLEKCLKGDISDCYFCDIQELNIEIQREINRKKEEAANRFSTVVGALGILAPFLLLSDYRFKEQIIYNGVNFCWKWKFANEFACGNIIGQCFDTPNGNYEFKRYIEFLGVNFVN